MNKLLLSAAVCLASLLQAREFTDTQGRKLEAELLSADGVNVTLKRAVDGKTFTVPASTFSAADQAAIREFAATNVSYSFEVKNTRERLS